MASSTALADYDIQPAPPTLSYPAEFNDISVRPHASIASLKSDASTPPEGLFIHFPSSRGPTNRHRARRLRAVINDAVMAAGMGSPSPSSSSPPAVPEGVKPRGSLYQGTYGQVITALKAAGLGIAPCTEDGHREATRLGALFVGINIAGQSEMRKLTLWG